MFVGLARSKRALRMGAALAAITVIAGIGIGASAYEQPDASGSAAGKNPVQTAQRDEVKESTSKDDASATSIEAFALESTMSNGPGRPLEEYEAEAEVALAAQQAAAGAEAARIAEVAATELRAEEERVAAVLAAEEANRAEAQRQAAAEANATASAQRAAALTQATPAPRTPTVAPAAPQTAQAAATSDIQAAAAAAGWPADQLAKVERVAFCESSGKTTAVSSAGYVGLMQVAPWLHGPVPADAVGQLAQAYGVYLLQGWGAWPVCGR